MVFPPDILSGEESYLEIVLRCRKHMSLLMCNDILVGQTCQLSFGMSLLYVDLLAAFIARYT